MGPALRFRSALFALLTGALVAQVSPAIASEDTDEYDHVRADTNSIHAGALSVQLLTFGSGTNGIFAKWHVSDRAALRLGTDFYISESSGDSPVGQPERGETSTSQRHQYRISLELEDYVDATGPVTMFLGAGPFFAHSYSLDDFSGYQTYNFVTYYDYFRGERTGWALGGTASAGFEWFFRRKLSVIGRVSASLAFGKNHDDERRLSLNSLGVVDTDTHTQFDETTASASTSSAGLGLGFHF